MFGCDVIVLIICLLFLDMACLVCTWCILCSLGVFVTLVVCLGLVGFIVGCCLIVCVGC